MIVLDGGGDVLLNLHLTAAGGAGAVGGDHHKVDEAGQVDGAAQVGHKDVGAAEDADQQNLILAGIVLGDLCAQFFHTRLQLFFGVQDFLDAVRHIHGSFPSLSRMNGICGRYRSDAPGRLAWLW